MNHGVVSHIIKYNDRGNVYIYVDIDSLPDPYIFYTKGDILVTNTNIQFYIKNIKVVADCFQCYYELECSLMWRADINILDCKSIKTVDLLSSIMPETKKKV
jgi:hypothetical protein